MSSLQKDIAEFTCNRQQAAYQEIVDDPAFKQLRQDIINLQDQIIEALPSGQRDAFLQYCELVNHRSSIMEEKVYRTGFIDGSSLNNIMYKSGK